MDIRSFFAAGSTKRGNASATQSTSSSSEVVKADPVVSEEPIKTEKASKYFQGDHTTSSSVTSPTSTRKRSAPTTPPSSVDIDLCDTPKNSSPVKKRGRAAVKKEAEVINLDDDEEFDVKPVKKIAPKSPSVAAPKTKATPKSPVVKASAPAASGANSGTLLNDMKICVTGVLESFSREAMKDFILSHGGKFATAVSGRTDLLVTGSVLEDGRAYTEGSKYRTAKEKGVRILTEIEFFEAYPPPLEGSSGAATMEFTSGPAVKADVATSAAAIKAAEKFATQSSSGSSDTPKVKPVSDLWVDKYKPRTPRDLVGHADMVNKLTTFLNRWDAVHIHRTQTVAFSKENPGARAALVSGPPGIGKTTTVVMVAQSLGYSVMELNASDTRNKSELDAKLSDAASSRAISLDGTGTGKRLIVMDEVDGMGGSDRGGMAELIKIIKSSRVPIICICNDRQSPKVRSLANSCYDLRARRPIKQQIAARLVAIAAQEGLRVEPNAAELLAEESGNDIRSALNALQMWSYGSSTLSFADLRSTGYGTDAGGSNQKDKSLRQSPFDACLRILAGPGKASFRERFDAFFVDYSLVPLLVAENYVEAAKSGTFRNPQLTDLQKLERLSAAADTVSDMDLLSSGVRGGDMHWELLPAQGALAAKVGSHVDGFLPFPAFPQWLGKYSTSSRRNRLVGELASHTSLTIRHSGAALRQDYAQFLKEAAVRPLIVDGKEGVSATTSFLFTYGLTRDDLMESLDELSLTTSSKTPSKTPVYSMANVDSQVKAALTRAWNSSSHKSSTVVPVLVGGLKKGKRAASSEEDDDMEDSEDRAVAEIEEEEEEDIEALRAALAKKKPAARGAAKKAPAAKTPAAKKAPAKKTTKK